MFDKDLHKEYVFLSDLIGLLPVDKTAMIDLEGKLKLEYYKLEKTFEGAIQVKALKDREMGEYDINYYFKNIEYDDGFYGGEFSSPDSDVYCKFLYDRKTKAFIEIWDNSKPIEDIMPIPKWWLDRRLEKNGSLRQNECKISY